MGYLTKRTALEAAIAAAVSAVLSLVVFTPLLGRLASGWADGDMLSTYVNAEMWSGFSYRVSDQMGYPLGMNLNYFPGVDITENLFAQLVTNLTGQPFAGINLLVVLSFPIVAALAYLVIRMTGLGGPIAVALAVAFSLIPYHWGRALGHTYLSTLYSATTGMLLALLIGSGMLAAVLGRNGGSRRRRIVVGVLVLGLVLVTAWTGVYYAAFTVILGLAALGWRFVKGDRWPALLLAVVPLVGILGFAFIGFLPSLAAQGADAPLAVLSERMPYESVLFAGVLAAALLPLPMNVLPKMDVYNRNVLDAVGAAPAYENVVATNFGTVVTSLALLVFLGTVAWRARRRIDPDADDRSGISAGLVGYLIGVTLLFFVPWALNYLIAGAVTAQIRGWNRLLPFLLMWFLVGAAVAIRGMQWRRDPMVALPVGLLIVLVAAVETVLPFRPVYARNAEQYGATTEAAREYATAVNAALEPGCGILQLPYFAYPEHGVPEGTMRDYDHFWTSLLNPQQRWSYGAVKYTDASVWAAQLPQTPTDAQLELLQQAGFCAIHLDLDGYATEAGELVQWDLGKRLGAPVAFGADGTWQLFALPDPQTLPTDRAQWTPELTRFLLPPFVLTDPPSMSIRYSELTTTWRWLTHQASTVTLTPIDAAVPLSGVRGAIEATECYDGPVTLTFTADGVPQTVQIDARTGADPVPFEFALDTPTGQPATLTIEAPGPGCLIAGDPARKYARVLDLEPLT